MQTKQILAFLLCIVFGFLQAQATLNRGTFYSVILGESLKEIDTELLELDKNAEAFKGAMLMKKSGLVTEAKDKLKLFKAGHNDLESAISADTANVEYRFLRLLIQENAPKIVSYNHHIKKDADYLRKHYKSLPLATQQAVVSYSKSSKELKPEDFKNVAHE